MDDEKHCLFRLSLSPGLGRTALFSLQKAFGSFAAALDRPASDLVKLAGLSPRMVQNILKESSHELSAGLANLKKYQIRIISYWDQDYPEVLRQIHDPPALLYVRGRLPAGDCFAIVGSRGATAVGLGLAQEIAEELASRGLTIVSGLARGIDSAAHRGALKASGATIAVLGCGVDRIYPPENARLYQQILEDNAIVSEFPPGTRPMPGHFPGRNRIISGLSRGVLIVEAADQSGSLITGDFALEQGRELFAVPGMVRATTSSGTNRLIKQGAQVVTEAADILENLWPQLPSAAQAKESANLAAQLDEKSLKLYQLIDFQPKHADELGRSCGLTPMEVSAILLDLELRGGVQPLPGGHYIRCR
jgi:DNA processing protein